MTLGLQKQWPTTDRNLNRSRSSVAGPRCWRGENENVPFWKQVLWHDDRQQSTRPLWLKSRRVAMTEKAALLLFHSHLMASAWSDLNNGEHGQNSYFIACVDLQLKDSNGCLTAATQASRRSSGEQLILVLKKLIDLSIIVMNWLITSACCWGFTASCSLFPFDYVGGIFCGDLIG